MPRQLLAILILLLTILMTTTPPQTLEAREVSPYLHKRTLENGLTVLVKETPGTKVATVQIWVKAGSVYEEPREAGITHLIEHMIFKGTPTRGPGELAEAIEGLGGRLNAYTSFESTVYHATLSARHWEAALEVLSDAVLHSVFEPGELEREKKVVLEEISMRNDRPEIKLFQDLLSTAYQIHPYRRPVIGSVESVSSITREDILAYVRNHYHPENLTVVVVGDVEADSVLQQVEELMGTLPSGEHEQPAPPAEQAQAQPRLFGLEADINQGHMALAIPICAFNNPDTPVLDVIAQILGQGETSRLYNRLRNQKQLVYKIDAAAFTPRDPGLLEITAVLNAEQGQAALEAALEEIFTLKYLPVSDEELQRAKRNLEGDFIFNLERVEGQARVLGSFEFLTGSPSEEEYLERVRSVTKEDIQRVASHYFKPANVSAGFLLPRGASLGLDEAGLAQLIGRSEEKARHGVPSTLVAEAFLPNVHRFQLKNGMRLLVREDPEIPTVALRAVFPGGLRAEDLQTNGAFAFISEVLPKGTTELSARQVAVRVANMAGELSGFNGKNTFGLKGDFLSRFFPEGLALLEQILRQPAFNAEEVEKVRQELLAQLRQQEDSLPALAFREFNRLLFQGHPYGLNTLGSETALQHLSGAELKSLYEKYARPDQLVLAVVGNVKAEEVQEQVEKLFGSWQVPPRGTVAAKEELLPPESPLQPEVFKMVRDKEQVHLILGFLGTSLDSQDRYGLELLDTILSGQSGKLFTELRDKQSLAYSLSSFSLLGLETGSFGIYMGTSPDKKEAAIQGVWQELSRIREEPVSEQVLRRAQNILIGHYELGLQTHGAQAMDLALSEVYGLGLDFGHRYIEAINRVDQKQLLEIARRYIAPNQYVLVAVGAEPPVQPAAMKEGSQEEPALPAEQPESTQEEPEAGSE